MIMEGSPILGLIISGLWIALLISLPILVIIVVARIIRRMVTPHDKEMQRLLERAVGLLEENNRLLNQRMTGRQPEEKQEATTPAG
jgi:flagellar motor component MotA